MIKEFKAFIECFQHGKELVNAATWKNIQLAGNAFAAFAAPALVIACGFDYCYSLDAETLKAIGSGFAATWGVINVVLTATTSKKVGIKPKALSR